MVDAAAAANLSIKVQNLDINLDVLGIFLNHVPEDLLKELLSHCDIATRSKLRRLNRYWKYLASLCDVNEVAIIDSNCLLRDPTDQQRDIFLGGHIRVIIYDDNNNVSRIQDCKRRLSRFIGMHCVNVTDIILKRVVIFDDGPNAASHLLKVSTFLSSYNVVVPQLSSLTIMDSQILSIWMSNQDSMCYEIVSKIPFLASYENIPDREILNRFIFPFSNSDLTAQRDWVKKYAPLLPKIYHRSWSTCVVDCTLDKKFSFKPFDTLLNGPDMNFVGLATFLILRENIAEMDPPPVDIL